MTDAKREIEKLLAKFASLHSAEDRRAFLLDHPVMISFSVVPTIVARDDVAVAFAQTVDVVGGRLMPVDGGVSINFNADRYPVGQGPIEKIWRQIEAKEILLARGIELARQPQFSNLLTFVYVKSLCDHCYSLLGVESQRACIMQRVVVEATEALATANPLVSADEIWQMRRAAGLVWIEAASQYLVETADPRILQHATALGGLLTDECQRQNDQEYLPAFFKNMGVLYLDPYTASRDLTVKQNYLFSLRNWQERLPDLLDDEYAKLGGERTPDARAGGGAGDGGSISATGGEVAEWTRQGIYRCGIASMPSLPAGVSGRWSIKRKCCL